MPVLTPAELWKATGRYEIPEVFKLRDRNDREFVLPMTHEETVTFHAREIQSYRDLPQMLYHFQTKDRDEPRPRAGLIRVREFIMKDSYSFDRDAEGLEKSFQLHKGAYDRIFERCELEVLSRPGRVGDDGREREHGLPRACGRRREHARHLRARRLRGRPRDRAWDSARCPSSRTRSTRPRTSRRPARRRSRTWRSSSGSTTQRRRRRCRSSRTGSVVLALVRGDDRLDEVKMVEALGEAVRPATEDEIRETFGADPGSIGPVGVAGRGRRRRGAARGPVRRRREPHGPPSARRAGGTRLRGALREHPRGARGGHVPEVRREAAPPDRDRGRPHLQARDALHRAARGDLPRRGRQGEAADHGQLRDRPRAHDGGDRRAAPRRAGDPVAGGRSRRTTSISSRCRGSRSGPRRSPRSSTRPGTPCSWTTATSGPARSSPTPT